MKWFHLSLLILVLMSSIAFAQTEKSQEASKFFEFEKISNSLLKGKFGEFYKKLKNDDTSQGYIINYGTNKEIAKRTAKIRNLINFRDSQPRFTFVQGGTSSKLKTIFWIVPSGAMPPTP